MLRSSAGEKVAQALDWGFAKPPSSLHGTFMNRRAELSLKSSWFLVASTV